MSAEAAALRRLGIDVSRLVACLSHLATPEAMARRGVAQRVRQLARRCDRVRVELHAVCQQVDAPEGTRRALVTLDRQLDVLLARTR
jgi:hypothetical protein